MEDEPAAGDAREPRSYPPHRKGAYHTRQTGYFSSSRRSCAGRRSGVRTSSDPG
jgi:hypothetical protein